MTMTTPINPKSSSNNDKILDNEWIVKEMSISAVLPTKASDGAKENNNESLLSDKESTLNKQSQKACSYPTQVILSATAATKRKEIRKFFASYFAVKKVLFCS